MEHKHISTPESDTGPQRDYDIYIGEIIPKFIIENGVPKTITQLDKSWYLQGFVIKRLNNKLGGVTVFGKHPNADINTDQLCLKEEEVGAIVNDVEALKNILINRLEVYYFDHSHFRPHLHQIQTEPVDGFMRINVDYEKGEIHDGDAPFRRIYPTEDRRSIAKP